MKRPNEIVRQFFRWIVLLTIPVWSIFPAGCERQQQQAPQQRPAPEVSTVTMQYEKVVLTTELSGRTAAYRIAEIRPQVSGIIRNRLFTEGSEVEAGDVLYQIDPAPFQAALDNAEASLLAAKRAADRSRAALKAGIADLDRLKATLELARKNKERYEDSFKNKIVSAIQRDQAVTEVRVAEATLSAAEAQVESNRAAVAASDAAISQAEAAIRTARINLGYCKVSAPISGRIGKSNVTAGAIVTAYQPIPLSAIQQINPIYADIPRSTTELLRIKEAGLNHGSADLNKVRLILEDDSIYPWDGTFQFSDITVDPSTGSVIQRVVFPNPEGVLLPGMFVRTEMKEGTYEKAVLVPQQGVSRNQKGDPFALVVDEESKAVLRMLTLDRAIADKWLVSSGLAPGDRVIVEGLQMLRPGTVVKAVSLNENPSDKGSEDSGNGGA